MVTINEIFDSLASGVIAVNMENRIAFLNRPMSRRLGVKAEDWVGRHAAELMGLIAPRLIAAEEKFVMRLGWQQDPEARLSHHLEWKTDEGIVHLREDSGPLRNAEGNIIGRVFVYHDISREREIDRMKSEFISVASHELRTPMTSIKGSVDLILSGFAGEITSDAQELLEIAQKSCDRLIRLINDILDLSKIEAGQIKLTLARMDLTDIVQRSVRGVRQIADQAEVTLKIDRPADLPPVDVDKDRIEQIVTNLLSNAIKFSPAQGEVRVELTAADGWVQCAVVDAGCGISEKDLPKVFGKFQQVGERRKGGTGLGLAITQALIQEHHGKIWIESQLNIGTRFIFRLPAATA